MVLFQLSGYSSLFLVWTLHRSALNFLMIAITGVVCKQQGYDWPVTPFRLKGLYCGVPDLL